MKPAITFITAVSVFAAGAFAEPNIRRSNLLSGLDGILQPIDDQLAVISSHLDSYVAGSVPGTVILTDTEELVHLLGGLVYGLPVAISDADALDLIIPIQNFGVELGGVVDQFIVARPNFVTDGLDDEVWAVLNELKATIQNLSNNLESKVSSVLAPVVDEILAEIVAEVQRGIDAYPQSS